MNIKSKEGSRVAERWDIIDDEAEAWGGRHWQTAQTSSSPSSPLPPSAPIPILSVSSVTESR